MEADTIKKFSASSCSTYIHTNFSHILSNQTTGKRRGGLSPAWTVSSSRRRRPGFSISALLNRHISEMGEHFVFLRPAALLRRRESLFVKLSQHSRGGNCFLRRLDPLFSSYSEHITPLSGFQEPIRFGKPPSSAGGRKEGGHIIISSF